MVVGAAGLVEHPEGDPASRAVAGDRRRFEELDDRADVLGPLLELFDHLGDRLVTLVPVLEVDEAGARVRGPALGDDLVAGEGGDGGNLLDPFGDPLEIRRDRVGPLQGGPRRGLDDRVDDPLILVRDEAGREHLAHLDDAEDEEGHDPDRDVPAAQDHPQQPDIEGRDPGEDPVEAADKEGDRVAALLVPVPVHRLEDQDREHRGQGQGDEAREDDRGGHRHRELTVEDADRAGHEGHRHEDRGHHQGDGDDRPADLAQDLLHRLVGAQVRRLHLGVDRLDDDDRVVDDDADREDDGEEGDEVDADVQHRHEDEGADERDRHRERRDQRRAPIAEEDEDDQRHQGERLEEGVRDLIDGGVDEARDVVAYRVVHPRREGARLGRLQRLLDVGDHLLRVAAQGLLEDDRRRGVTVEVGVDVEELAAELDLGHVLEPEHVAVGRRPDDDILVLLRLVVAALPDEGVLEGLRRLAGGLPETAGAADNALLGDRLLDLVGRDVVGPHPVGV